MADSKITPFPTRPLWVAFTLLILSIFVGIAAYSALITSHATTYDQKRARERYANLDKQKQMDAETLNTIDWISAEKGTVRLPIDQAIAHELPDLAKKPLKMGQPIPGAAAPPPPKPSSGAPPPSPTPGAAPTPAAPEVKNPPPAPAVGTANPAGGAR